MDEASAETALAGARIASREQGDDHKAGPMKLNIVLERRDDGRWIAEIPQFPGLAVLGADRVDAYRRAEACALRMLADQLEQNQAIPGAPAELSLAFAVV
jgi:predicted RNase H-like HicB family nuclease